ncbi:Proteasome activator PA28 like protein [Aduncisulcus paluster]|uniref:Proteasome activator PA28 like protein n=1 Tax=Aduncisulcus paluster TaxID=2918883 RepID=A0ABQ5KQV3_9EUKA|nr:Proteasome activator PA28 like protein [Aduncisulcus paluster]
MDKKKLFKQAKDLRKKVKVLHDEIYRKAFHSISFGLPDAILRLEKILKSHPLLQEGYSARYAVELKRTVMAGWIDEKELLMQIDAAPLETPVLLPTKKRSSIKGAISADILRVAVLPPKSFDSTEVEGPFKATKEDISLASLPMSARDAMEMWRVTILKDVTRPVVELYAMMKDEIVKIAEMLNSMKMMFQLRMPKIEGGQNFGLSVQTGFLSELGRVEDAILTLKEESMKYHLERGKLLTKLEKMPTVRDLYLAMIMKDEKELSEFRSSVSDIKSLLLIIYDQLRKNEDVLLKVHKQDQVQGMVM